MALGVAALISWAQPGFAAEAEKTANAVAAAPQQTTVDMPETIRLNLSRLIAWVAEKNLDIFIAKTRIKQAKGYLNSAFAGLLPSIRSQSYVEQFRGGEIFIGATPFTSDRDTYQARISADYQIQLGGKVLYQVSQSRSQLARMIQSNAKTSQTALRDTLTQYFTWLRDAANVEAAKKALEEADAQLKFAESRFRHGFIPRVEVTQAQVLQAQRRSELLKAENDKETSAIALASMMNLPLAVRIEPEEPTLQQMTLINETLTLQDLYQVAVEKRPDLKELTHQIAEAKARYGASRADLFPTITLSGYHRGLGPAPGNMQQADQLYASINIDLLKNLGLGTMGDMQVQRARIQEAILNKAKQLNEIQKTLAQAYEDSKLYKAQIAVAKQKMDAAAETHRIAKARLKRGVGLQLEVIQAHKDLADARQELETAIMNYNNTQLKLLFETGQLTPQTLMLALNRTTPVSPQNPQVGLTTPAPLPTQKPVPEVITLSPKTSEDHPK